MFRVEGVVGLANRARGLSKSVISIPFLELPR